MKLIKQFINKNIYIINPGIFYIQNLTKNKNIILPALINLLPKL